MGNTSLELAELEEQYGEDVDNDLNDLSETNQNPLKKEDLQITN